VIPISLHLSNFLSYGPDLSPLDFTSFHTACLSGNNGNGKSALLDGLTWSLWGKARNATPSLLRLGQSEMRAEFVFDLEGERYRVTRGYLKNKRSSATLEVNVLDSASGLFRPITRPSVSESQGLIDGLLRMNYETFLSSAYLKQGQADRFSQQPPGDRKKVLAEILGLGRYQEIADKAREEARGLDARVAALDAQIEGIEKLLATRGEVQEKFTLYQDAVRTFAPEIEKLQATIDEKTAMRIRLDERRKRATQIETEAREVTARVEKLQSAHAELQRRHEEIEQWRAKSDEIAREMEQYGAAKDALARWDAAATQHAALREEHTRLKELVDTAAADLRRQLADAQARISHEEGVLRNSEATLSSGADISRRASLLKAARTAEADFATRRAAHEKAQELWREADAALRTARLQHENSLTALQKQFDESEAAHASMLTLEPQLARAEEALAAASEASKRLEELQRQQLEYESQLSGLKQRCEAEKANIAANEDKLRVLQENPDAECPLCRSELGEHGRDHIESNLAAEIEAARGRIDVWTIEGRAVKKAKDALEEPLRATQDVLREAPQLNAEAARLRHARDEARTQAANSTVLCEQLKTAKAALESGAFAPELAQAEQAAKKALEAIGYDRAAHELAMARVQELAPVEREALALDHARELKARSEAVLAQLAPELLRLQQELDAGEFAREASAELARVRAEAKALGYNEDARAAHREARALWDTLQHAPVRWDRLQNELSQSQRVAKQIADNAAALADATQTRERLDKEAASVGDVALQLAACERALSEAQTQLKQLRDDEREARTELGKQQQALDELARRETERASLAEERKTKAREAFVLSQALIIENAIPEIQDDANAILRRLTRNEMQISLESQREKQSGGTRETLDIKISDDKGTREYLLFSGGEAFRADFALRIALSKLLARRAGTQLRTLIIDEGFGTQDSEGLQNMIECIQTIAEDFSKVLVVTHLDVIKNAFPTRIEVHKDPATGSHYEVLTG
jgi:exonuclease SbcC